MGGEAAPRYARSRAQYERVHRSLAGGLASAFRAPAQDVPITFVDGHGPFLRDVDGNEYVDYALAFGPMLLGHSPERVLTAVRAQLSRGIAYGGAHKLEAPLAEAVCRAVPCAERCVFSNSGSEAVHAAVRIARSATGRTRVVKFLGHFHGWLDPLAIATPGLADASPATGGQDPAASEAVTVCQWNDIPALEAALGSDIAAVIMEPIAVNGGCLLPDPGYLDAVRDLTRRCGALLIFDEVITGFRVALGGAQELFGVTPDLAVLGKALGSGFPISAVCGSSEVMDEVVSRRVAHIGTFNANPVGAAAAVAAVEEMERSAPELYPHLEATAFGLVDIIVEEAEAAGLPLAVNRVAGAAYGFWSETPVETYDAVLAADKEAYRRFAGALLDEGVHVISRGLLYLSATHGEAELERTRAAVRRACAVTANTLVEAR